MKTIHHEVDHLQQQVEKLKAQIKRTIKALSADAPTKKNWQVLIDELKASIK